MLEDIKVELFENNNDDLTVVNTARVSFNKHRESISPQDEKLIRHLIKHNHVMPLCHSNYVFYLECHKDVFMNLMVANVVELYCFKISVVKQNTNGTIGFFIRGSLYAFMQYNFNVEIFRHIKRKAPISVSAFDSLDRLQTFNIGECSTVLPISNFGSLENILNNLDMNGALTCQNYFDYFKLATFSLRITAPIHVLRQHTKTQLGMVRNEISRRYVNYDPTFYPQEYRAKPDKSIKQGSSSTLVPYDRNKFESMNNYGKMITFSELSLEYYQDLIANGVAPECARGDLTQNMITSLIETGGLEVFSRFLSLRLGEGAQDEIKNEIAMPTYDIIKSSMNNSIALDKFIGLYDHGALSKSQFIR